MTIEDKKFVVIGTSGSPDYLNDTTGDRRFWPLVADEARCDGIHDENAPIQYLCSKCFQGPRGDLTAPQDDEYDEDRRDVAEEME